ncbi:hypothetical protein AC579_5728 [Pseudocercospora musae]|uniref:Radical SAM core domain-containing protein n=1 Tax=Pseudocercospora musae TaxID=113226 RepID=A0A139IRP7_9PEZI|nr:hypothetical protein AC579_5728 [Pseudocercospora musae]
MYRASMANNLATRALPRVRRRWPQPLATSHRTTPCRGIATAASVDIQEPEPYMPNPTPILASRQDRKDTVWNAKPFSDFLTDTYDRQHEYLRISLTERCNLRCTYCMPEEGVQISPNREILTTPEIYYLSALFVNQGVNKIRLTGGEPTVRKDIVPLMQKIGSLRRNGLKELALTTNGISLHRKLDAMIEAGLTGVNISLDTLDPLQFPILTRRQGFSAVMKSINRVQEMNKLGAGIKLKINCVAMRGVNDDQIIPFVEMTRDEDIEVRFIEYMPFGGNKWSQRKMLPYAELVELISTRYPTLGRLKDATNDTSKTWQVPGFKGRVGFITSMTHNFCGTCNRLRITSDGNLKVCLHGNTEVNLRDVIRADNRGEPMDEAAFEAIRQVELDRRKHAEDGRRFDGEEGWISKERQLLEVIGAAVKRKKAKHAGMGKLENMENRPMILIGEERSLERSGRGASIALDSHYRRSATPWSSVHWHLLRQTPSNSSVRFYSNDNHQSQSAPNRDAEEESNCQDQAPSLASALGFQSLSGLFKEPKQGRYSRPRQPHAEVSKKEKRNVPRTESDAIRHDAVSEKATQIHTEKATSPPVQEDGLYSARYRPLSDQAQSQSRTDTPNLLQTHTVGTHDVERATKSPMQDERLPSGAYQSLQSQDQSQSRTGTRRIIQHKFENEAATRRQRIKLVRKGQAYQSSQDQTRNQPNPFTMNVNEDILDRNAGYEFSRPALHNTQEEESAQPWRLRKADGNSVDSISIAAHMSVAAEANDPRCGQETLSSSVVSPAANMDPGKTLSNDSPPSSTKVANALTHLTSAGEAHMVDVGAKPDTKRIAISTNVLKFSNDATFKAVAENSNKKGDVLGVARIAGIMAAKRASDIIPLCHPLIISKVELEFSLISPNTFQLDGGYFRNGGISITAEVHCTGATGVEMEALTAVTAAGLTAYDMCKAIDKDMSVSNSRVVYKAGGKSGTHVSHDWARSKGSAWFQERNYDVPAVLGLQLHPAPNPKVGPMMRKHVAKSSR